MRHAIACFMWEKREGFIGFMAHKEQNKSLLWEYKESKGYTVNSSLTVFEKKMKKKNCGLSKKKK